VNIMKRAVIVLAILAAVAILVLLRGKRTEGLSSGTFNIREFMRRINRNRASVGSKPLAWDKDLAGAAVAWAKLSPGWPNSHGHDPRFPEYNQCVYADGSMINAWNVLMKGVEKMWREGNIARANRVSTMCPGVVSPLYDQIGHWCILAKPTHTKIGAGVAVSAYNQRDQDGRTILTSVIHVA
jgi:hypothetical protein